MARVFPAALRLQWLVIMMAALIAASCGGVSGELVSVQ